MASEDKPDSREHMSEERTRTRFDGVNVRIENLEASYRLLRDDMATGFDKIQAHHGTLERRFTDSQRAPWGVIVSAMGLVLAIGGVYSTLQHAPTERALTNNRNTVQEIQRELNERRALIGNVTSSVTTIDTRLRELRDDIRTQANLLGEARQNGLTRAEQQAFVSLLYQRLERIETATNQALRKSDAE